MWNSESTNREKTKSNTPEEEHWGGLAYGPLLVSQAKIHCGPNPVAFLGRWAAYKVKKINKSSGLKGQPVGNYRMIP